MAQTTTAAAAPLDNKRAVDQLRAQLEGAERDVQTKDRAEQEARNKYDSARGAAQAARVKLSGLRNAISEMTGAPVASILTNAEAEAVRADALNPAVRTDASTAAKATVVDAKPETGPARGRGAVVEKSNG